MPRIFDNIEQSFLPAIRQTLGDFYIRDGGGKKKLNAQQAMAYVKQRWGSS